ncbi:MAG: hypothetical protein HY858_12810 [Candidatus Solibacter usitatus]|nr:hypothetical protein [Candidatus Solibacter usitatus]
MTKVEVRYEFTSPFQDSWTPALESLSSVYGLQQVRLGGKLDSLTICFDASRLRLADVDGHLRRAGLPVRRVEAAA